MKDVIKNIFKIRKACSKKISFYLFNIKIFSIKSFKRAFLPAFVPKFGVSYSVFDGEEILEASIRSIRNQAEYVNVVYQTISWRGNPADPALLKNLKTMQEKGLIDEIIFFQPNLKESPQLNEITKRNVGLKAAIAQGVNYFMTMDVDEFFLENELKLAKKFIIENGVTHSYCAQILYGSRPNFRMKESKASYIQFFSKVDKFSTLGDNQNAPCLVDPTRKLLERKNSKHFVLHDIFSHHMTRVRKDLKNKYVNSSYNFKNLPILQENDDDFIEVGNLFNIPLNLN